MTSIQKQKKENSKIEVLFFYKNGNNFIFHFVFEHYDKFSFDCQEFS